VSDLSVSTETYGSGNQTWLGSKHGVDECDSITLDLDEFTLATHYPDGYIPSGTVVATVTSGGLYAPYDDGDSPAGVGVAEGHLLTDVHVRTGGGTLLLGALFTHGQVVEANLPDFSGGAGEIDAAGIADLPHIRYV
jgi:hypothetical protein